MVDRFFLSCSIYERLLLQGGGEVSVEVCLSVGLSEGVLSEGTLLRVGYLGKLPPFV